MLKYLKSKILLTKNRKKKEVCKNCIWHKSEEHSNMPFKKHVSYCSINGYTADYFSCSKFEEELFVPKEGATETREYSMDMDVIMKTNDK